MNRLSLLLTLFPIPLLLAASHGELSKSPNSNLLVEFRQGQMSVKAEDVALEDLLNEVGKKSGVAIELRDTKAAEKQVTLDFKNFRPEQAFTEILRGLNFALFYSRTRLVRVVIAPPGVLASQALRRSADRTDDFTTLLKRDPVQGLNSIRKALKESNFEAKLSAIDALESFEDSRSIDLLGEALTDRDPLVREAAIEALADKEGAIATKMLRRGLNDRNPEIRMEVLEELAHRGDLEALRAALSDPNRDVRETAAELLEDARPQ